MNWRAKALLQQVFSNVPGGGRANYLMQTKVTRSLPASERVFDEIRMSAERHIEAVRAELDGAEVERLRGYGFGAGWHLGVAVGLAALGVGTQTLIDREPLAHEELVRHTLGTMAEHYRPNTRMQEAERAGTVEGALAALGISYLAPVDATATGLEQQTFDFVTSTSTLEHIPESELVRLLRECHRLLRPGGVLSAMIDYGDHYAAFDRSITRLNFLQYNPSRWRLYCPAIQFQNRLRHSDHLARLEEAGFEIVQVSTVRVDADAEAWARSAALDPSFDHYEWDDLVIGDAHIVCVRR